MNNILNILDSWSMVGEVSESEAKFVFENLDLFVEDQFKKIAEYTQSDNPETALSLMMQMTNFLSAAGKKVPKIITKLGKKVKKYQSHANALGQKLNASSFSIAVGFPSGVTLTLSWNI